MDAEKAVGMKRTKSWNKNRDIGVDGGSTWTVMTPSNRVVSGEGAETSGLKLVKRWTQVKRKKKGQERHAHTPECPDASGV